MDAMIRAGKVKTVACHEHGTTHCQKLGTTLRPPGGDTGRLTERGDRGQGRLEIAVEGVGMW